MDLWARCRRLLRDEEASTEVEYLLITGMVVVPMFLAIPPMLISVTVDYFDRIHFWINLPIP